MADNIYIYSPSSASSFLLGLIVQFKFYNSSHEFDGYS